MAWEWWGPDHIYIHISIYDCQREIEFNCVFLPKIERVTCYPCCNPYRCPVTTALRVNIYWKIRNLRNEGYAFFPPSPPRKGSVKGYSQSRAS
jgi:hypothetical protein